MSEPSVIVRRQGRTGRITLNRPKALHALNAEMCELITRALLEWASDDDVELVIVDHAEGTRGFCAGGDVLMLAESGRGDGKSGSDFFAVEYRLNTLIKEYPKPYIAVMDGITMGGGVGISVHGTYRIATERTVFAMPESGIGLAPDVGGGYFLPRLMGEVGMWLALTGDRLKGQDVLAVGVATHFSASEDIHALTEKLCERGTRALKGLQTEAVGPYELHQRDIDTAFSQPTVEAVIETLEAGGEWAQSKAKTLATKSPLSMKIAMRQLGEGAELSFRETMQLEYRLCCRLIHTPNFQEGVRAVLIDKDNSPKWVPGNLAAVSDVQVDAFFAPLDDNELSFLEV